MAAKRSPVDSKHFTIRRCRGKEFEWILKARAGVFNKARAGIFSRRKHRTEKQALELTVEKWDLIVRFLLDKGPAHTLRTGSSETCALCQCCTETCQLVDGTALCPVARASGATNCGYTPYYNFDVHPLETAIHELDFLRLLVPGDPLQRAARRYLVDGGFRGP